MGVSFVTFIADMVSKFLQIFFFKSFINIILSNLCCLQNPFPSSFSTWKWLASALLAYDTLFLCQFLYHLDLFWTSSMVFLPSFMSYLKGMKIGLPDRLDQKYSKILVTREKKFKKTRNKSASFLHGQVGCTLLFYLGFCFKCANIIFAYFTSTIIWCLKISHYGPFDKCNLID